MQFEPSLHNRGEGILVHAASGHAHDFLELLHQTGDYRVLFLKEIQLRIDRPSSGLAPTAAGCRSGWERRRDGGSLEGRALRRVGHHASPWPALVPTIDGPRGPSFLCPGAAKRASPAEQNHRGASGGRLRACSRLSFRTSSIAANSRSEPRSAWKGNSRKADRYRRTPE